MSSAVNEVIRLLSEISISEDPKSLLVDLKTTLIALSNLKIKDIHENLQLKSLYDRINSSDNEQVDVCVDVLDHLVPMVGPKLVLEQFGDDVLRGFVHPNERVRVHVLKQIHDCAEQDDGISTILASPSLLTGIIGLIGDNSLGVVKVATATVVAIAKHDKGLRALFSNHSVSAMENVMAKSDSCRFHMYEVAIRVSLLSNEALKLMSNSGLIDRLIGEVTSGDILTQLNALEMLTSLAVNPEGLQLLENAGLVSKLQYLLSLSETDPMASLLLPGLIKFFGNLGNARPDQLIEEHSPVFITIMKLASGLASNSDPSLQVVAIETVSHIGMSPDGKLALSKFKMEMNEVLSCLSYQLKSSPSERKVRVLESLSKLFFLPSEYQTDELVELLKWWWNSLMGNMSLERLVPAIKQPFQDLQVASLECLKSLAHLPWGVKMIACEPGFIEYLLNRESVSEKSCKELKWEVMGILTKHSLAEDAFGSSVMSKITHYYNQGPFYVEAIAEVTFERED